MPKFEEAYKKLNSQQKQAVDAIDGPVMVIAGPGTGKTQLLGVRVANILHKTDSLPDNILCLTYTEAAASEMRNRLVGLIGQQGYDVNVLTFHSFGNEVINRFPEKFYQGAAMEPIDDITAYSLLRSIFEELPHKNPLSSRYFDDYTYLKDTQRAIGDLKKAAISPEELRGILKTRLDFLNKAEPIILEAFDSGRVSKKILPIVEKSLEKLQAIADPEESMVSSLSEALESGTTQPVSAWKRQWLAKSSDGSACLKDNLRIPKLQALADVYEEYQNRLARGHWFDYDDMVMQVIDKLAESRDLLAELQEQYLYILVDEFQDTNDGQLKLLRLLADNPVNEGRPNILVVGDDDQAIYKFQGADISNMHSFASWVKQPKIIPLTDIYRYSEPLLELSKSVIERSQTRLSHKIPGLKKQLKAVPAHDFKIERLSFEDEFAEYNFVADQIAKQISSGTRPDSIAVIARQHSHLEKFADYAAHKGIPLNYERREDILDQPIIKELIHYAKTVIAISEGNDRATNELMPELLSYRFWQIDPVDLWKLNKQARTSQSTWMDTMLNDKKFKDLAENLLTTAQSANNDPLSVVLDLMIGVPDGPFYSYYFKNNDKKVNSEYLALISSLKTMRQKAFQYSGKDGSIKDLLEFVDLQRQSSIRLVSTSPVKQAESAVSLLSAHSAKGLEFDHVYILHAQDNVWGAAKRGAGTKLPWISCLNISPAGDDFDDRVRLFYVAITRARTNLTLTSARTFNDRASLPLRILDGEHEETKIDTPAETLAEAFITDWSSQHHKNAESSKAVLEPYLQDYRLSVTHMQNFLDVTKDGPSHWFIYNLLRFPAPMSPSAAYGSAIHAALSEAQKYLQIHSKPKPTADIISDFQALLEGWQLSKRDYNFYLQRGEQNLTNFLKKNYKGYKPEDKTEVNFYNDNVVIKDALVTGMADRINIASGKWDNGEIEIIDFKTGKPMGSWKGKSDFDKIKLHHYKQQLIFYELLTQKSKRFKSLKIKRSLLQFVEPDENQDLIELELQAENEEFERFELLIRAVWQKMQNIDLPDTNHYPQNIEGIIAFEDDLISSA